METRLEDCVIEEEIFFLDDDEHTYTVKCYDGHAIAVSDYDGHTVKLKYPTISEVKSNERMAYEVLNSRGLYDLGVEDITYGDIMLRYGEKE